MLAFFQKWAYYWCIDVFKVCSIKIFESQGCPLFDCFVDVLYNNVGLRERLRKKAKFVENLMSKEILFLKICVEFYGTCLHCRFSNKESAGQAICGVHGQVVNEQQVKCSWGKESNDAQQSQSSTPQMMGSQSVSITFISHHKF